jgi:hypothetical protein
MPTAHSLVAPTQKMSDDAAYPSSPPQAQPHGHSIPPQNSHSPYAAQPDARALTTRPAPGAPPVHNPYAAGPAAPQVAPVTQPRSIPPVNNPPSPSIPPVNAPIGSTPPAGHAGHGSQPPRTNSQPPRAHTTPAAGSSAPQPRRQTPAESVAATAPAGRRWGLIIVVLLIDIGLAASGAWMLSQGL